MAKIFFFLWLLLLLDVLRAQPIFCFVFLVGFWFGLFFGLFGWEFGLGEDFFHAAWECVGYAWAPQFPSRINVCYVRHCLFGS